MESKSEKLLKNVIFLLVMLKMCVVFGQNSDVQKRIVIDPGHGGFDSGAIGVGGILEKDVALKISLEIIRLNKTIFDNKFDLYLTRYQDTFISLSDRGRLAKLLKADLFLSIHCNAAKTGGIGIEVFVHNSKKKLVSFNLQKSEELGLSILNEGTHQLKLIRRGVKFANFQVLRETIPFCPGVLVETGFLTNNDEADYFLKPKNIRAMALAILMGLYNYLNSAL